MNDPALPCDDVGIVSFAGDLLPLLDVHCTGCHSGGAPSAGLDLSSHDRVAESTLEGSLLEIYTELWFHFDLGSLGVLGVTRLSSDSLKIFQTLYQNFLDLLSCENEK